MIREGSVISGGRTKCVLSLSVTGCLSLHVGRVGTSRTQEALLVDELQASGLTETRLSLHPLPRSLLHLQHRYTHTPIQLVHPRDGCPFDMVSAQRLAAVRALLLPEVLQALLHDGHAEVSAASKAARTQGSEIHGCQAVRHGRLGTGSQDSRATSLPTDAQLRAGFGACAAVVLTRKA